jgi:hypothetical protein
MWSVPLIGKVSCLDVGFIFGQRIHVVLFFELMTHRVETIRESSLHGSRFHSMAYPHLNALWQPAPVVIFIFDGQGVLGELEGAESIDHHRQLAGLFGADALFHRAGVRPMRDAAGVQGDHAPLHVLAAHEVAIHIVEHLVAVDVAVVVGRRDGQRVVIVQARHERADDEVVRLEGLVHRRRLVYPPGDGLEIVDGKSVGVEVAIPAHQIEGVVEVVVRIDAVLLLDVEEELALLVVGLQILRLADVALAEGRVLLQLAEGVAVALGRDYRAVRLDDEQAVVGAVEFELIDGAARHHHIIAVFERHRAVHGAQPAAALMDEDDLVGVGIFEEVLVMLRRGAARMILQSSLTSTGLRLWR